jgi:hypothetical protein
MVSAHLPVNPITRLALKAKEYLFPEPSLKKESYGKVPEGSRDLSLRNEVEGQTPNPSEWFCGTPARPAKILCSA